MAERPDVAELLERDPHLAPYVSHINKRYELYEQTKKSICDSAGSLDEFSLSYKTFGFHRTAKGVRYCEWLPGAQSVSIFGDFNGWDAARHVCSRDAFGVWTLEIHEPIAEQSRIKLRIVDAKGNTHDRIPAWIRRAEQDGDKHQYIGVFELDARYDWKHMRPARPAAPKIYEAHIGISSQEPTIASYRHFADNVLPRIENTGYNVVQLMAVMEHAYYASFGYQVTSFFAASSRYGSSADLKYLVDTAHGLGISVLLDVVHSHASKNTEDGLNMADGTDACYFHAGVKGHHPLWDSRLFDYGKLEVLRFLLSNLRYYLEEFQFDGFRFDGVTSMLYLHHGLSRVFTDYNDYFNADTDIEACVYLMLANDLVHTVLPSGTTIAEEVSGMPALCCDIAHGGFGFDFKLAMAIPDMWIKLLKEKTDEQWEMGNIVFNLENRRYKEPVIAYAESHDQALVGDKTLAFWLMDKEMYTHMSVLSEPSLIVDRGVALHKMIRLITHALGGEGYLNFIGNEFGHPEWLDFPRKGNNESYQHCRRQWALPDDSLLKYKYLLEFDKAMNLKEESLHWLASDPAYVSVKHEQDKVIVFERNNIVFVFNFHWDKSYTDYKIPAERPGIYQAVFSSDDKEFGGFGRVAAETKHFSEAGDCCGRQHSFLAYLPTRTAILFTKSDK